MKLNDRQKEIIEDRIDEKFPGELECPLCQNTTWSVNERIYQARELVNVPREEINVVPLLLFMCTNCSNVIAFSAIQFDILDDSDFEIFQKGGITEEEVEEEDARA